MMLQPRFTTRLNRVLTFLFRLWLMIFTVKLRCLGNGNALVCRPPSRLRI